MSGRVTLGVTLELCSDAIFGSGFSVPGGEDIAVCQDGEGYPYLMGSTFKGLLRESLENLLAWTGQSGRAAGALCGEPGWEGVAEGRRLQLTALFPDPRPETPEDCFSARVFTSLEGGTVKEGSLRTAACIRRGMRFTGAVTCDREDVDLLRQAVQGIKWAGALRSRGFGRVKCALGDLVEEKGRPPLKDAGCIRYRLRTRLPVLITDRNRRQNNSYATRDYLPGSAIRGMVAGALAQEDPEWFASHRAALLGEGTRFLDALPCAGETPGLPGMMGFYGEKGGDQVVSVLNADVAGMKRAGLGTCCALEGETVRGWSTATGGSLRILRQTEEGEAGRPFQTRHIEAGQTFEGYILLDDPTLAGAISKAFGETVWLGADRYEGFGQCAVTLLEEAEGPGWLRYGYAAGDRTDSVLYLLALSPFTMLDPWGEPCGLDPEVLAGRLGVEKVEIQACSTAMAEFSGYNRAWKCRTPALRMYERGSIFKLRCSDAPRAEALLALQRAGLGVRRAEGFGQVLFLRRELLEGVRRKAGSQAETAAAQAPAARLRRARYRWVMDHSGELYRDGLSKSQLGAIQALCEKAMASGDTGELMAHLDKNTEERGAQHAGRFLAVDGLIRQVLNTPLEQTLGVPGPDSPARRLGLLCMLFDYSRKGENA